eukprot:CAMPEP_0118884638 /NCGR_PEP_ID=MMETSP1163-20130328/23358_1 /TAXON_ID=124430 /ORGANISM="Phaeomonas parva, Strain CCMP2877" /LENGTH=383 /DNA_ID=CAMNT_0006822453 /DNA_START=174 /DNA_END=1325 /DNA_ORIENTATION=+
MTRIQEPRRPRPLALARRLSSMSAAEGPAAPLVVITGCDVNDSFGGLTVLEALKQGFNVLACCDTEAGAALLRQGTVGDKAGLLSIVVGDLTTNEVMERLVKKVNTLITTKAVSKLYGLVNNATVSLPGNVYWANPSTFEDTMAVNFMLPMRLTHELLPHLLRSKGRIVNVSSVAGFYPTPADGAFSASKAALESYSDTLRVEMMRWGVKVSIVQPSPNMKTPMTSRYWRDFMDSFLAAPAPRRAPYGMEWAKKMKEQGERDQDATAQEDPCAVSDTIVEALTASEPKARYLCGASTAWYWRMFLLKLFRPARNDEALDECSVVCVPSGLRHVKTKVSDDPSLLGNLFFLLCVVSCVMVFCFTSSFEMLAQVLPREFPRMALE